jgi:heme A synthase
MRTLFAIVTVLMLLLGVGWLFFPHAMLASWNVQPDDAVAYIGRRYGGLLFGYAVILWLSRASEPSTARSAILAGGAVATGLMTVISLVGVLSRVVGPAAWSAVVIEAILAIAFAYYYVTAGRIRQG